MTLKVNVSLSGYRSLHGALVDFAFAHGLSRQEAIRMVLARYLSKEGYYRTGGRGGARKGAGRKKHAKATKDAPEIKAATRIDFHEAVGHPLETQGEGEGGVAR